MAGALSPPEFKLSSPPSRISGHSGLPRHVLAVHDLAGIHVAHFDGAAWVVAGDAQHGIMISFSPRGARMCSLVGIHRNPTVP